MIGNVMDMSEDDVRELVLTLIFGAMCVLDRTCLSCGRALL